MSNVVHWIKEIESYGTPGESVTIILGNKLDISTKEQRKDTEKVENLAEEHGNNKRLTSK